MCLGKFGLSYVNNLIRCLVLLYYIIHNKGRPPPLKKYSKANKTMKSTLCWKESDNTGIMVPSKLQNWTEANEDNKIE